MLFLKICFLVQNMLCKMIRPITGQMVKTCRVQHSYCFSLSFLCQKYKSRWHILCSRSYQIFAAQSSWERFSPLRVHAWLHCFTNEKHHLFMHSKTHEWKAFQRWCQIITLVSKNVFVLYNKMIYQASVELFKVQTKYSRQKWITR